MYRFLYKSFDYFSRKSPVLIHTPRADSIGNCAEELFFGLLKAKRENKKILFLYPQNLVFRKLVANQKLFHVDSPYSIQNKYPWGLGGWILRNLFFRRFVANQKLFHVQSPSSIQNRYAWYLGGWLLTLMIALMWLGTRRQLRGLRRILGSIWPKSPSRMVFDFAQMTPTIGRSTLWKPGGVNFFSWQIVKEQNWRRQYDEYVPPRLVDNDYRQAERLRVQIGIPLDDWFVCLHVREAGYRGDIDNPRNASIQNYIKGIEVITAAGGWVVRLGDRSVTPLPPMDHVIDYPHTRFKSELMDIYLLSQCRFYVGGASGPLEVANLFGKPQVLVNVTGWSMALPVNKGDLAITKHIFFRPRNRFLSITEILEEPYCWPDFGTGLDGYVMVENTSEEIRDVIEEFLAKSSDHEYSDLQEAFNEGRRDQIHRWFDQEGATSADLIEMYRVAARCDSSAATLGHKYLEQNWFVDQMDGTKVISQVWAGLAATR